MAILLLIACFTAIFFTIGASSGNMAKSAVLLCSVLVFSVLLTAITELLSCFKLISYPSLFFCWSAVTLILITYLYFKRPDLALFIAGLKRRVAEIYSRLSLFERVLLTLTTLFLLLAFVQGIINPPNNSDSLTYHLARIPSWISHRSVSPYPTHIVRQLYQPPFAEYVILHVNLLSGGDYFSASVQFFFLLFSLTSVVCIIKSLGLGRNYQVIGFILAATIPEVVLQASSTQNDIVVAFFILSAFYFYLRSVKEPAAGNYLCLGLSIGLGMLTKGTAYLFMAPILLLFGIGVLIKTFTAKKIKHLVYAVLLVAVIPIIINACQFYRNYTYSQDLLGVDKTESKLYRNERMTPALLMCNFVKNADCHMGILCIPRITFLAGKITHGIFKLAKVDINDPATNFPGVGKVVKGVPGDSNYYNGMLAATHEDFGPNCVHFFLILFAVVIMAWGLVKRKKNRAAALLTLTAILQIVLFCAYLKWQAWGTRLETGIFLLAIPLVCYACAINAIFRKVVFKFAVPFSIFYAFLLVLFNYTRPYISYPKVVHGYVLTAPTSVFFNRYKKIFAANATHSAYSEYKGLCDTIRQLNDKNIGLVLGYDDWEYPLFTNCYTHTLNPVHIMVNNYTKDIKGYSDEVDCIVSTSINKPYIDYKGKRFYNKMAGNTVVWYYR